MSHPFDGWTDDDIEELEDVIINDIPKLIRERDELLRDNIKLRKRVEALEEKVRIQSWQINPEGMGK